MTSAICPKCGNAEHFRLRVITEADKSDDAMDIDLDAGMLIDGSTPCRCMECDFQAPLREFDGELKTLYTVVVELPLAMQGIEDSKFKSISNVEASDPLEAAASARQQMADAVVTADDEQHFDHRMQANDFNVVAVMAGDIAIESLA